MFLLKQLKLTERTNRRFYIYFLNNNARDGREDFGRDNIEVKEFRISAREFLSPMCSTSAKTYVCRFSRLKRVFKGRGE